MTVMANVCYLLNCWTDAVIVIIKGLDNFSGLVGSDNISFLGVIIPTSHDPQLSHSSGSFHLSGMCD